jgi:2'-5' RNA ligase
MSAGGEQIRLFVAVPVPPAIKEGLSAAQGKLRRLLPSRAVSWPRPENMHLTLHFLGNVDGNRLEALAASLKAAAAGFGALPLVAERLGAFPDLRQPRVLWAWVHDPADRLAGLQRRVVAATDGFTEEGAERSFTGHITLARIKRIKRGDAERIASFLQNAAGDQFGGWTAEHLELIRSELSPKGSRYTCLAQCAL